MITSSGVIMPRSPWLASPGCTKKAGVPVEAKVAAILRRDVAGLAHAGDDDAALGAADQLDRGDEGLAEPIVDRGGQRCDAAGFGLQRAQRRFDERMALARFVAVADVRFRHGARWIGNVTGSG